MPVSYTHLFSATHNTFDFGTRHKAGHVVVVCKQSRTFKMFRNLLFLSLIHICDIIKDSGGDIWSGGYCNLKRINPETGDIRLYPGLGSITAILELSLIHI